MESPRTRKGIGLESQVRSEINVTPLVDVCLVLLIIFMVITPLLQEGVSVALPVTARPEKMPEAANQLDVAIKTDGNVFIGENWVPRENVEAALADIYARTPDRHVVLKADRRLAYREVRSLMKTINEAGFTGVGLATLAHEGGEG